MKISTDGTRAGTKIVDDDGNSLTKGAYRVEVTLDAMRALSPRIVMFSLPEHFEFNGPTCPQKIEVHPSLIAHARELIARAKDPHITKAYQELLGIEF